MNRGVSIGLKIVITSSRSSLFAAPVNEEPETPSSYVVVGIAIPQLIGMSSPKPRSFRMSVTARISSRLSERLRHKRFMAGVFE